MRVCTVDFRCINDCSSLLVTPARETGEQRRDVICSRGPQVRRHRAMPAHVAVVSMVLLRGAGAGSVAEFNGAWIGAVG